MRQHFKYISCLHTQMKAGMRPLVALALVVCVANLHGALTPQIPANAHSTSWGKRWECDRGFREAGGVCNKIAIPPHERKTQAWALSRVLYGMARPR